MATQRTFSIIKPDATRRNLTGAINAKIEEAGLRIVGQKRIHMTKAQAEAFMPSMLSVLFNDLVSFMISGPVVVQVLEGENAVCCLPSSDGQLTLQTLMKALFAKLC